ncbi:putative serine/threonine protein kinase [Blattamonas nauphoetae]|uniref:Serine/threonine protein kinase n=1 Tax=Blattamonas nauphoetae TaxID=2049346 RepID=A0ABQ9YL55_9EUKA|nr:putative serine/threonine protein kinase [Blattamonas nauphoetae]
MHDFEEIHAQNRATLRFEMLTGDSANSGTGRKRHTGISLRRTEERQLLIMMKRNENSLLQDTTTQKSARYDISRLYQIVAGLSSNQADFVIECCKEIQVMLNEDNNLIQEIIDAGTVPSLLNLLRVYRTFSLLLTEVLWCLCNIAAGTPEQTNAIVSLDGISVIAPFINDNDFDVALTAVKTIAYLFSSLIHLRNIAINSLSARTQLSEGNVVHQLIEILRSTKKIEMKNYALHAIVSIINNSNSPQDLHSTLPIFVKLLSSTNVDALRWSLHGLFYITQNLNFLQFALNHNFTKKVMQILTADNPVLVLRSLQIVLNISRGDDDEVSRLLDDGFLDYTPDLFNSPHPEILRTTCIILNNFCNDRCENAFRTVKFGAQVLVSRFVCPPPDVPVDPDVRVEAVQLILSTFRHSNQVTLNSLSPNLRSFQSGVQLHDFQNGKPFGQCVVGGIKAFLIDSIIKGDMGFVVDCVSGFATLARFDTSQSHSLISFESAHTPIVESGPTLPINEPDADFLPFILNSPTSSTINHYIAALIAVEYLLLNTTYFSLQKVKTFLKEALYYSHKEIPKVAAVVISNISHISINAQQFVDGLVHESFIVLDKWIQQSTLQSTRQQAQPIVEQTPTQREEEKRKRSSALLLIQELSTRSPSQFVRFLDTAFSFTWKLLHTDEYAFHADAARSFGQCLAQIEKRNVESYKQILNISLEELEQMSKVSSKQSTKLHGLLLGLSEILQLNNPLMKSYMSQISNIIIKINSNTDNLVRQAIITVLPPYTKAFPTGITKVIATCGNTLIACCESDVDMQKHAFQIASKLMANLSTVKELCANDNNTLSAIKSLSRGLTDTIEKTLRQPKHPSLQIFALDCLTQMVDQLGTDIQLRDSLLESLFRVPFGSKLCQTLNTICRIFPEYLPSFQTRLLISEYEILVPNPNQSKKKATQVPLVNRITLPPTISFPVTKLGTRQQTNPIPSFSLLPPPLQQIPQVQIPSNCSQNTEICIACIIQNSPPITQCISKSSVSNLSDVRCHLLNRNRGFLNQDKEERVPIAVPTQSMAVLTPYAPQPPSMSQPLSLQSTQSTLMDDTRTKQVCESFRILTEFDFSNHYLAHYLRDVACPYLVHHNKEVRLRCAEAIVKLLISPQQSPPIDGQYWQIVREILLQLLLVMASDVDEDVRLTILRAFGVQYDFYLSLSANLNGFLFPLLFDESPAIRDQAIINLSRLAPKNPATVVPRFHDLVVTILKQLQFDSNFDRKRMYATQLVRVILYHPETSVVHLRSIVACFIDALKHSPLQIQKIAMDGIYNLARLSFPVLDEYKAILTETLLNFIISVTKVSTPFLIHPAFAAFGQVVQSTCYVIVPLKKEPRLLSILMSLLNSSSISLFKDSLHLLGILGALSPTTVTAILTRQVKDTEVHLDHQNTPANLTILAETVLPELWNSDNVDARFVNGQWVVVMTMVKDQERFDKYNVPSVRESIVIPSFQLQGTQGKQRKVDIIPSVVNTLYFDLVWSLQKEDFHVVTKLLLTLTLFIQSHHTMFVPHLSLFINILHHVLARANNKLLDSLSFRILALLVRLYRMEVKDSIQPFIKLIPFFWDQCFLDVAPFVEQLFIAYDSSFDVPQLLERLLTKLKNKEHLHETLYLLQVISKQLFDHVPIVISGILGLLNDPSLHQTVMIHALFTLALISSVCNVSPQITPILRSILPLLPFNRVQNPPISNPPLSKPSPSYKYIRQSTVSFDKADQYRKDEAPQSTHQAQSIHDLNPLIIPSPQRTTQDALTVLKGVLELFNQLSVIVHTVGGSNTVGKALEKFTLPPVHPFSFALFSFRIIPSHRTKFDLLCSSIEDHTVLIFCKNPELPSDISCVKSTTHHSQLTSPQAIHTPTASLQPTRPLPSPLQVSQTSQGLPPLQVTPQESTESTTYSLTYADLFVIEYILQILHTLATQLMHVSKPYESHTASVSRPTDHFIELVWHTMILIGKENKDFRDLLTSRLSMSRTEEIDRIQAITMTPQLVSQSATLSSNNPPFHHIPSHIRDHDFFAYGLVSPQSMSLAQQNEKQKDKDREYREVLVKKITTGQKFFDLSHVITSDDLVEHVKTLTLALICYSPNYLVNITFNAALEIPNLSTRLFNQAFACFWDESSSEHKRHISAFLEDLLQSRVLPAELATQILLLDEYMEKRETPLPIALRLLSTTAMKIHAIPYALRFTEMELIQNVQQPPNMIYPCWHSMIFSRVCDRTNPQKNFIRKPSLQSQRTTLGQTPTPSLQATPVPPDPLAHIGPGSRASDLVDALLMLNATLQENDAISGVCMIGQDVFDIPIDASKLQSLQEWERASQQYRQSLSFDDSQTLIKPTAEDMGNLVGLVRCQMEMGEDEEALKLALNNIQTFEGHAYLGELLSIGSRASFHMHEFDSLAQFVQRMDNHSYDYKFYSAILAMHNHQNYDLGRFIDAARDSLRQETVHSSDPSYNRLYPMAFKAQLLIELEEACEIALSHGPPEQKGRYLQMWKDRLFASQFDCLDWRDSLAIRQFVLPKEEDLDVWLKYASLSRKVAQNTALARTTLLRMMNVKDLKEDEPFPPNTNPRVIYAYIKDLLANQKINEAQQRMNSFMQTDQADQLKAKVQLQQGLLRLSGKNIPYLKEASISFKFASDTMSTWAKPYHKFAMTMNDLCKLQKRPDFDEYLAAILSHFRAPVLDITDDSIATAIEYASQQVALERTGFSLADMAQQQFDNQEIANEYNLLIDSADFMKLLYQTFFGFSRAIQYSKKSILQDTLRLLNFLSNYHNYFIVGTLARQFKIMTNSHPDMWLDVIPQLIAQLDLDVPLRSQLHEVLLNISEKHPNMLLFPLIVATKSNNGLRKDIAEHVLDKTMVHSREIVFDGKLVSHELIRIAVTMDELWYYSLDEISGKFYHEDYQGSYQDLLKLYRFLYDLKREHNHALQNLQQMKNRCGPVIMEILQNDLKLKVSQLGDLENQPFSTPPSNESAFKPSARQNRTAGYSDPFSIGSLQSNNSVDEQSLSRNELKQLVESYAFELNSTPERRFLQQFEGKLKQHNEHLTNFGRTNDHVHLVHAWDGFKEIWRELSPLTQFQELNLNQNAPVLAAKKSFEMAMPGTTDPENDSPVKLASCDVLLKVFPSKQRPRFINMNGSDGNVYRFLLKGREDIRMDERVMQLFGLINTLFASHFAFKELRIRRNPIIPLSQQSGLIGLLCNHFTMNQLIKLYRSERGIRSDLEHAMIAEEICPPEQHRDTRHQAYDYLTRMQKLDVMNYVAANTPGRDLYDILWLDSDSTDRWFERRRAFTRSNAIMSMVGHILGLGDRHPSNLMLEPRTARVVHIDFGDCFEVAKDRESFAETVPFRLTRMMLNAMDIGGVHGAFRRSCERIMSLLRSSKGSIMAMLEAFVLDPLVHWWAPEEKQAAARPTPHAHTSSEDSNRPVHDQTQPTNRPPRARHLFFDDLDRSKTRAKASKALNKVEAKLKGLEFEDGNPKTSSEQVSLLIEQAIYQSPYEDIYFKTKDGTSLHGWFLRGPVSSPIVVYCHGNAGNLQDRSYLASFIQAHLRCSLFLFDYRGYGRSSPELVPNHRTLQLDTEAAVDWAEQQVQEGCGTKLWMMGHSIGGAATIDYVANHPGKIDLMIVENTIYSMWAVAKTVLPPKARFLVPFCVSNVWRSYKHVKTIKTDSVFIMGEQDELVPSDQTLSLYLNCAASHKTLIRIPEGTHNTNWSVSGQQVCKQILDFANSRR